MFKAIYHSFIKIIKKVYCPKPLYFNALIEYHYEFGDMKQIIELRVLAFNTNQAQMITQNLLKEFNEQEKFNFKIDSIWKLKNNKLSFSFQDKKYSYEEIIKQYNFIRPSTTQLQKWSQKGVFDQLKSTYNHITSGSDYQKHYKTKVIMNNL